MNIHPPYGYGKGKTCESATSMATLQSWSTLPKDILTSISKILSSDVEILRLRSVCSSWRSSLPRPRKRFTFPLKLPLVPAFPHFPASSGYFTLHQCTFYRLSPPTTGPRAGDPSNAWLLKVLSPKPDTFALQDTLTAEKLFYPQPKTLSLLEYRISEIRKSYNLNFFGTGPELMHTIKKVIALWSYLPNCDFAALILRVDGSLSYWKFGDKEWTPINNKGHEFQDVILWDGICYAVDRAGVLASIGPNLKLTVVSPPVAHYRLTVQNYLVECGSDLCLVSKVFSGGMEPCFRHLGILTGIENATKVKFGLMVSKFSKCNGKWNNYVGDLGDRVLVLGVDTAVCVFAKDFKGCKGNTVYLLDIYFSNNSDYADMRGVYHLDDRNAFTLLKAEDVGKIFWPASWLHQGKASSSK